MDIFSKPKRSDIMSKVSGKDTKPEIIVRKYLFSKGFRYRKNAKELAGKPDISLPKYKTLIFVHGCFWHQHPGCAKARRPASNTNYWEKKLDENIKRDKKTVELLENTGWRVVIIWQCETKDTEILSAKLKELSDKDESIEQSLAPDLGRQAGKLVAISSSSAAPAFPSR